MADKPNQFEVWMERVIQGDQQAVAEVFERYREAMLIAIRYRLDKYPRLRTQFDSTDFLLEVWEDFLSHPEKYRDIITFEGILKHLASAAGHKVEKARRRFVAQKRDLRRSRHLSDPGVAAVVAAVADPHPDPAQQAAWNEAWGRWIALLSPRQREVSLGLRDGLTYQEIAAELGCSKRSIKRIVAELRDLPPPEPLP